MQKFWIVVDKNLNSFKDEKFCNREDAERYAKSLVEKNDTTAFILEIVAAFKSKKEISNIKIVDTYHLIHGAFF